VDEAALRFYQVAADEVHALMEVAALADHTAHQVAQPAIFYRKFPLGGECTKCAVGGVQDFFHTEGVGEEIDNADA
jgi:hypothetical protein